MLRYNLMMIGLSGMAIAAATPQHGADAQSGQALVFGERACQDYGVMPGTTAFESCVKRAARSFDRGEPDLAYQQARVTRDAREACRSFGIDPETLGYQHCVANQINRAQR